MTNKRVLIIDDDLELNEELAEALQEEGYSTDFCLNPIKGEALIRNGDYDIILLDNKLSGLTGIDILKKLKADNIRKRIFIFSGSPSAEQIIEEENLSDMVSGIINKPVNFKALLDKIEK